MKTKHKKFKTFCISLFVISLIFTFLCFMTTKENLNISEKIELTSQG